MIVAEREERACPACGAREHSPFIEERIDWASLDHMAFASRKIPEFMNLRLVRCRRCDLVYAPQPLAAATLLDQYAQAGYDSGEEAKWAAATYADALRNELAKGTGSALEIGAGNGAFLPHLVAAGFSPVLGIEPSTAAIEAASPDVHPLLVETRVETLAPAEPFALVCCFMTLEHVAEPDTFLAQAARILKPGGTLALVVHDWSAPLNRLLGRRSPIIDIEHMQIFHPRSLTILLTRAGFDEIAIRRIRNRYPLRYWTRLLPFGAGLKRPMLSLLQATGLGGVPIAFNVGNLVATARWPG